MREYKFRGKRITDGQWVYGSLLQSEIAGNGYVRCALVERFADSYNIGLYEVYPETVGMWTGQVYNKIELFEGDIVEIEYHDWALNMGIINPWNEDKSKKVIRLICRYGVDSSYHLNRIDDCSNACYSVQFSGSAVLRKEIIGNIHDNPHLLNPAGGSTGSLNMTTDPKEPAEEVKQPEGQEQATETQAEVLPDKEEGTEG